MNRFSKQIILWVCAVILGFSMLFLGIQNRVKVSQQLRSFTSFFSKIDDFLSQPFLPFYSFLDHSTALLDTYEENERLKDINTQLTSEVANLEELKRENASLRSSLSMKEAFPSLYIISSKVSSRSPLIWYQQLKVNSGKDDKVTEGMFALSGESVVGVVSDVETKSSVIDLLTNTNRAINLPVQIKSENEAVFGILTKYHVKNNLFVIEQLSSESEIKSGDRVLTSGLDGRSTANLLIGEVVSVDENKDSLLRKVYVKSSANFSDLTHVTLVGEQSR